MGGTHLNGCCKSVRAETFFRDIWKFADNIAIFALTAVKLPLNQQMNYEKTNRKVIKTT